MEQDIFAQNLYFYGLYKHDEQIKINLASSTFYTDLLNFYIKKKKLHDREKLVIGVQYLLQRIRDIRNIEEVLDIWESVKKSMLLGDLFYAIRGKSRFELVSEFVNSINNAMYDRREKLITTNDLAIKRLRKEAIIKNKIIDSLSSDKNSASIIEGKIEKLCGCIRHSESEKLKNRADECFNDLLNEIFFLNANDKQFAAIALIFFQTGWLKKDIIFNDWLKWFSEAFGRKKPNYKPSALLKHVDIVKLKIPFLNEIEQKSKQTK